MRKSLSLITLFFSIICFGQNCKYKTNEIDEFTKNKILETKIEVFTVSGMGLGFSTSYTLKKINEKRYLNFKITSPSIFTLREGDKIMFKTDSENTIDLIFPNTIIANNVYNSHLKTTTWLENILIPIDELTYQRLSNEKVLKLRVYTTDGYIDDDINEKRSKKFKELLKCIE